MIILDDFKTSLDRVRDYHITHLLQLDVDVARKLTRKEGIIVTTNIETDIEMQRPPPVYKNHCPIIPVTW